MKSVGIICEYSPFHYGHLYHLEEVKKRYPLDTLVLILSGNFTQRGLPSCIDKWSKTEIALYYGVDLVIELPFVFATQSADIFARGSIALLKALQVDVLLFGSEENDVEKLTRLAMIQSHHKEYDLLVRTYLKEGINYPTALNRALEDISGESIRKPNDLLGLSYIKEILKQDANITPVTIQRTSDFHDTFSNDSVVSATKVRSILEENGDVSPFVPPLTKKKLDQSTVLLQDYDSILFYKLSTSCSFLSSIQTVDEGIEHRILQKMTKTNTISELLEEVKTKRYTYNKLTRMMIHILCNFTKEEAKMVSYPTYLRVLGMSKKGQSYLSSIKKELNLPLITSVTQCKDPILEIELRATSAYASILPAEKRNELICLEYNKKPVLQSHKF